jgi:TonB family protein
MRRYLWGTLTGLVALGVSANAAAEWRCDCTSIVGSCQATANVRESFVEVTSDVQQCARVDYLVDGIPFVAMVVDGADRQDWIAQSASPSVIVQSCQVCRDNSGATLDLDLGSGLVSDGEPMLLISVDPEYPADAAAAGLEGWVDVHFSISALGTVSAPEVVAAEPAGIFDAAALAAVSRWRYTQPPPGESRELTQRIEFDLSDALLSLSAPRPQARAVVAGGEPRRNDCVREETRFDFGSMVDVSLINACSEPLLVYSCTAGTGAYRNRWICSDPEQTTTVLDARAGAGTAAGGATGLRNVDRLDITRAANSEYWWLACAVDDGACRAHGREWIRSLDRQTATIDPQDRSQARLARSF